MKQLEQQIKNLTIPVSMVDAANDTMLLKDIPQLNEATLNRLRAADIFTIGDLRYWTRKDLLCLRGFGPGCLKNLEESIDLIFKPPAGEDVH